MESNSYEEKYFVGVRFESGGKIYYFATDYGDLTQGDLVVTDTVGGEGIGIVASRLFPISEYRGELALKPILRKPNRHDLKEYKDNIERSKKALQAAEEEIRKLGLPMRLFEANYSLDGDRCTISFFSENRVDFRELLKNLSHILHCRIELRQIPPRDKARMVGGIGICGLPLCCSTFLKEFDGISIARAKNQMLTLNIPKLSGPCTKLICCLRYEDDAYTEEKKLFPPMGKAIKIGDGEYKVTGYNVLSRTVKVQKDADIQNLTLEEYDCYAAGKVPPKRLEDDFVASLSGTSSLALPESTFLKEIERERKEELAKQQQKQQQNQQKHQNQNQNKHRHGNNQNRNNNQQQNKGQQKQNNQQKQNSQPKQNNQNQQGQNSQNKNRNRRRRHRGNGQNNNSQNNGNKTN